MKKILISARDLRIGGIEKSLIELINFFINEKYKVTLALEKKEGVLIKQLNNNIRIVEYKPCSSKYILFRKIVNFLKRTWFIIISKNKYDLSISYATYSKFASFAARISSKNSILWCHADYLDMYSGNEEKFKNFFKMINFEKFSEIVFVSKRAQRNFLRVFPEKHNTFFCNNLINCKKILKKAKEKINIEYDPNVITFLNVGRHDEKQKKLTRIINASIRLKQDGYKFRVFFVGSGVDTLIYKNLVKKHRLQENIIFTGAKENPYPYFRISDCVVISSDYEGYPVVFLESYILNKPIITTKVSDYEDIQNAKGIVVEKNERGIYCAMKEYIENGYKIGEKFNSKKYDEYVKKKVSFIVRNAERYYKKSELN